MKINMLLSIVGPRFEESLASGFRAYAEWDVIAERDCRLLVDAVGEQGLVELIFQALDYLGRNPRVIGAWRQDGSTVEEYPLDVAAWLAVAPEGESEFRELHGFQGWAPKQAPEATPTE